MSIPSRLLLVPGRWVDLPGAGRQALLHGKIRTGYAVGGGVEIERTGNPAYLGGWNLTPVRGRCYVRRAP